MKRKTMAADARMAMIPWRIESAPSDGPTVRSSRIFTGAGRAPALRTLAGAAASSVVKPPRWGALPPRPLHVRLLVDKLELEKRGLPDQGLGPLGILEPGKLDQDSILPLLLNRGLGDPQLVDSISDRLQALANREVGDLPR